MSLYSGKTPLPWKLKLLWKESIWLHSRKKGYMISAFQKSQWNLKLCWQMGLCKKQVASLHSECTDDILIPDLSRFAQGMENWRSMCLAPALCPSSPFWTPSVAFISFPMVATVFPAAPQVAPALPHMQALPPSPFPCWRASDPPIFPSMASITIRALTIPKFPWQLRALIWTPNQHPLGLLMAQRQYKKKLGSLSSNPKPRVSDGCLPTGSPCQ